MVVAGLAQIGMTTNTGKTNSQFESIHEEARRLSFIIDELSDLAESEINQACYSGHTQCCHEKDLSDKDEIISG
jgi:hypothetical protein